MADNFTDDLEPLFDYRRVQPTLDFVCLDGEDSDLSPIPSPKRRKTSKPVVKAVGDDVEIVEIVNGKVNKDEEDWLPLPPKISVDFEKQFGEDSTIKELRLKKQELEDLAKSAKDILQAVEDSVKRELNGSFQASLEAAAEKPSKPPCERAKIVISIQDKDGPKQFRVYKDEKFERIFKMYADKVKRDIQNLVFSFDGDKVSLTETPDGLGMEDDDIIEVHAKKS